MCTRVAAALSAAVLTAVVVSGDTQAPPASSANRARASEFLEQLKKAVDVADRRTVAAMVAYPLTVLASGFNIPVQDAANFNRLYDSVFTPELRCAVVASELPSAAANSNRRLVTLTPDALSMVDGAIWAPFKDGRYRIGRIRVLPRAPSVEGRTGIEHVAFEPAKGERSRTYTGWLVRQNVDAFVVALRKGETIQARIEGFRGHDASLRLSTSSRGATRSATPVPDIGRNSSASASADTDYLIEVAHLAHYCDPPQRYTLTLTIQ